MKDYPHYKLNRRISSTKLLSKFIKLVETAQKCFIEKINEAKELLIDNAVSCRLFDDELQDSDCSNYSSEDTLPPIEKLKDGTWKKICPILKCNRRVFKLGRHLTDIHSELSEEQRAHAKNIAQVIAKRIAADDPTTPCSSYTKKNPAIKGQQREYRNCFICGKLYLNIPDHLKKTHKLDKESLQYQTATLKSTVVPNKFITTSSGKPEMMNTFTEIEEMYPERTTKQELYAIKTEIIECTNKINTAAADEEQSEISEKLSKLKEKYKLIRYGDKRIYSSESMTWRTRFTAYLERKK